MIRHPAPPRSVLGLLVCALIWSLIAPTTTIAEPGSPAVNETGRSTEFYGPPSDNRIRPPHSDSTGTAAGRSYVIPAAEILTYIFAEQYDRHFVEPREDYRTSGSTIRQHLTDSKWVIDNDQFKRTSSSIPTGERLLRLGAIFRSLVLGIVSLQHGGKLCVGNRRRTNQPFDQRHDRHADRRQFSGRGPLPNGKPGLGSR